MGDANGAMQEFHDAFRERQLLGALLDLFGCQVVLHNKLSETTDDFR